MPDEQDIMIAVNDLRGKLGPYDSTRITFERLAEWAIFHDCWEERDFCE